MDDTYYSLNSAPTMAAAGGHRPQVLDEPSLGSAPTLVPGGGGSTPVEPILGRIDQYELIRKLGGGGFGVVYLARDTNSGVEVALKTLHPLLKSNAEEMDALREKFALVARLTHTNIAKALVLHPVQRVSITDESVRHELHLSPGDSVMVMDYAPGVTLSKWRRQFPDGKVPLPLAIEIGRQIASALDYAHGEKIVHRDIKPSNVMVETLSAESSQQPRSMAESGLRVRILDFGLAAEIRSSMSRVSTEKGDTSGTRPYMAPEQWMGKKQDGRTDQYALACLLYELISSEPPFAGVFETGDAAIMANAVENRQPEEIDEMSAEVNDALQKALSKNPADRFSNCSEFVAALEAEKSPRLYVVAALNGEEVQGAVLTIWEQKVELPAQLQVETGWTIESCTVQLDLPGRGKFHGKTEPITVDWKGTKSLIVPLSAITASASNAREADSGPRADAALAHGFAGKRHRFLSWLLAGAAVVVLGVGLWRFVGTGSQSGGPTAVSAAPSVIEKPASKGGARSPSEPPLSAPPTAAPVLPPSTATRAELEDALTRMESHRDALVSLGCATDDPERKQVEKALATLRSRIDAALEEETRKAQEEELADRRAAARRTIYIQTFSDDEKTLDALARECAAAEAAKLAATTLRKAERVRKEAEVKRDSGRYEEAAAGYASAKKLFETACAEARAAKADAFVGEARAYGESKMWYKCLYAAQKALEWEPSNAGAKRLKEEAESKLSERQDPKSGDLAGDVLPVTVGGVSFNLRWCPPGSFMMGSPSSEDDRESEETQHRVTLTKGFWIGETEVTQGLWKEVMGATVRDQCNLANKSWSTYGEGEGDEKPIYYVSWNDCQEFISKLNLRIEVRKAGLMFSLPTEAQWEYACRAGTTGAYGGIGRLDDMGWYSSNYEGAIHPVASKKANAWGVYDMHGNVSEWCQDWYGAYPDGSQTDPSGPSSGSLRVFRGGSRLSYACACRSAQRRLLNPGLREDHLGLRLTASGRASKEEASIKREAEESTRRKPVSKGEASFSSEPQTDSIRLEVSPHQAGDVLPVIVGGVRFNLRWCPAGSFMMGSPASEEGRRDDEIQHRVTLTHGFWMGETEVTQGLWQEVMRTNPSHFKSGDNYPVENVSWKDCQEFISKLNSKSDVRPIGLKFSLPTEAQWEYASRAGSTGEYGETGCLDDIGWYSDNSGNKTHPVRGKVANAWGLCDMHGNVTEWCQDWYESYLGGTQTDLLGSISDLVLRGGSYWNDAQGCRSANRDWSRPDVRDWGIGLRLVATSVQDAQ